MFHFPTRRAATLGASLGAALTLVACVLDGGGTGPAPLRSVGALQLELSPAVTERANTGGGGVSRWLPPLDGFGLHLPTQVVVAPDTVTAGMPFDMTVNTVALDGCWSADGGELAVSGSVATATPYDRRATARVCTMVLGTLAHHFSVSFDTPGEALIRVPGRRVREGDARYDEPVTAERTVVVR
jgi:hypothetical protein